MEGVLNLSTRWEEDFRTHYKNLGSSTPLPELRQEAP
jgi:hypothetical protein